MEVVAAFIGFVGAVVGALSTVVATEVAVRRRQAREAARLAMEGLFRWRDAIAIVRGAPDRWRRRGGDYDVWLAIELRSLRDHLSNDWWQTHASRLADVSSPSQWEAMQRAGRTTAAALMAIDALGNVGEESLLRVAEARQGRSRTDRHEAAAEGDGSTIVSDPPAVDRRDEPPGLAAARAEADAMSVEIERLGEDIAAGFAELEVLLLDHRLFLVQDAAAFLLKSEGQIDGAVGACAEIADATASLWAWRRQSRSARGRTEVHAGELVRGQQG